jgi:hypothetical protein
MESIVEELFSCCFGFHVYDPKSLVEALGFDFYTLMSRAEEDHELCYHLYIAFLKCRYRCLEEHLAGTMSQNDARAYIEQIDDYVELFLQDIVFPAASEDA